MQLGRGRSTLTEPAGRCEVFQVKEVRLPRSVVRQLALVVPLTAWPAWAGAECGTFEADDGDNIIVWGVPSRVLEPSGLCRFPFPAYLDRRIGVCWRDAAGVWRAEEFPDCDKYTAEPLRILAKGGDDVVIPVTREYLTSEFRCPADSGQIVLEPFHEKSGDPDRSGCWDHYGCAPASLDFGVEVHAGEGADVVYGSPEVDWLHSGAVASMDCHQSRPESACSDSAVQACVCAVDDYCCLVRWDLICVREVDTLGCSADGSRDTLCGMNGDDRLYGDGVTSAGQTCLDGGSGDDAPNTDYCWAADGRYDQAPLDTCEWTDATEVPGFRKRYCCSPFRGCGFNCLEPIECFDACGDPLNPPFQSLVVEQIRADGFEPWFDLEFDLASCQGYWLPQ